jgi:hypothetical protein
MSSDFAIHSAVSATPPVQVAPPPAPPKPPKSQSDHKAQNETTSPRGPAVVLSGALAKPADKPSQSDSHRQGASGGGYSSQGQSQPQSQSGATGQHINHVL